jgi:formylglycine-generating enzyme required for sulfatase activity
VDFIRASEEAENQRLNAERQRLEQMAAVQDQREKALEREKVALLQVENALRQAQAAARNRQRAQNAVWALLVCIIVGLVGWINQAILKEQWQWYTVLRPYMVAKFKPYVLTAHAEGVLQPANAFRECEAKCPEMIVIPAGRFMMGSLNELGSEDERPVHNAIVTRPFAVGKYEVTVDEWNACVSVGICPSLPGTQGAAPRAPVANVSWEEARLYVAWLSRMTGKEYRLLTEREWEYSARANTVTTYSFGDDPSLICRFANIADATLRRSVPPSWPTADCSDGYLGVAPVGSYQPNSFGLHDMHGNVWEWVEDCYGPYKETDNAFPVRSDSCPRVLRGGAFDSVPDLARSSNRNWAGPGTRQDAYGFRVARTLAR